MYKSMCVHICACLLSVWGMSVRLCGCVPSLSVGMYLCLWSCLVCMWEAEDTVLSTRRQEICCLQSHTYVYVELEAGDMVLMH
jgi:hypothetical protein